MVSATGPTSAIGIPQKNTGDILPKKSGDVAVEYISLEDGGDTTRAVQNIKKLVQENNIDALIGPSTTPNALAILPQYQHYWQGHPHAAPGQAGSAVEASGEGAGFYSRGLGQLAS